MFVLSGNWRATNLKPPQSFYRSRRRGVGNSRHCSNPFLLLRDPMNFRTPTQSSSDQLAPASFAPNFTLLTMHKAASSYVGSVLQAVFVSRGYRTEDLASEAFEAGVDEVGYILQNTARFARSRTYFGPFRTESATPVSTIKSLQPIVHIRDPRDCIVSLYYSLAFSHVEPGPGPVRDKFLADREAFREMGVDEFCFEGLRRGYDALGIMRRVVEARPDSTVSRYEDMVSDFARWLQDLLRTVDIQISETTLNSLQKEAVFEVSENPMQHKRQVTPGDYRRKLRADTQKALTGAFESDLRFFGYEL